MEIINIKNLDFTYAGSSTKIINNCKLSVEKGEIFLIIGESGSGKSTLLRLIKHLIAPYGEINGNIFLNNENITDIDKKTLSCDIAYVSQFPDEQIVTETVASELAFGLENSGFPPPEIRRRVAETVMYFNLSPIYNNNVNTLSGGQKQLLNLASALTMRPKILLLDEPTAQLDPIARDSLIATISQLNRDFGITIVICEHYLENLYTIADSVGFFKDGTVQKYADKTALSRELIVSHSPLRDALPSNILVENSVFGTVGMTSNQLTHRLITENFVPKISKNCEFFNSDTSILLKNICFRYTKNSQNILNDINLKISKGECLSLIGGNGCGKTTTLLLIAGILKPQKGRITLNLQNITLIPQDPQTLFVKDSVFEDLQFMCSCNNIPLMKIEDTANSYPFFRNVRPLFDKNPLDLSGGELQTVSFLKILLKNPDIILLDEPTKGLDSLSRQMLLEIIETLKKDGVTVVISTHDLEFSSKCSTRCAMLFNGEIAFCEPPRAFFHGNNYFTPPICKIAKRIGSNALTVEEFQMHPEGGGENH